VKVFLLRSKVTEHYITDTIVNYTISVESHNTFLQKNIIRVNYYWFVSGEFKNGKTNDKKSIFILDLWIC